VRKARLLQWHFAVGGTKPIAATFSPTTGKHPEWHIQDDVLNQLGKGWDMMIAFPPCTYLTVSGNAWMQNPERQKQRKKAIAFVRKLMKAPIEKIAIEKSSWGAETPQYEKPDQIIQPFHFGDKAKKTTCLWLKNLPPLEPTDMVDGRPIGIQALVRQKRKGVGDGNRYGITRQGI
jgi:hypothetical protein